MSIYLGAQLYTVRDFIQNETDFAETIRKVAEIGYTSVQVSGIGKVSPECIKEATEKYGIKVVLTHWNNDRIKNDTDAVIKEHDLFGAGAIGVGGMGAGYDFTEEGVDNFARDFAPAIEKIKAAGKVFLYHNHSREFVKLEGGEYMIDRLLRQTDPDGLKLTFDVYWGVNAGIDPAKFIQDHQGRVYCTHLKDMAVSDKGEIIMKECLDGNINFDPVIEMSKKCGVAYHLVEQDNTYGRDQFEALKISHDNLKARYDFK